MSINRNLLLREPAKILFKGAELYSQGSITVKPVTSLAEINTSVFGVVDRTRITNRMFTVSGVLAGEWKDLAVLFEILGKRVGQSIYESTDTAMVIHGIHGNKLTLKNAAITKPPVIIGKAGATLFGAFEAMAIVGNALDPSDPASYYAFASASYPGDADFDPATLLTLPLSAAWGESSPWDEFATRDGWTITPEVSVTMDDVDGIGTADIKMKDVEVKAVATPAGITQAQLFAKSGHGQGLGAKRTTGDNLVLTADGVYIRLTEAVVVDGNTAWGDEPVVGAVTWTAARKWVSGVAQPLLVVADEDPDA